MSQVFICIVLVVSMAFSFLLSGSAIDLFDVSEVRQLEQK